SDQAIHDIKALGRQLGRGLPRQPHLVKTHSPDSPDHACRILENGSIWRIQQADSKSAMLDLGDSPDLG
ncbi:hypothetical protein, partial [Novosphingobium endophyticum]|uniref:hypothetical protein n=1 Tax=Novosphingobium endophyticum TaxID=1955250 RepID=UPI001E40B67E